MKSVKSEPNVVISNDGKWGGDPYNFNSAILDGDELRVAVSYSGGCRDHQFTLVVSEEFMESDPVQLSAVIAHTANGDPCEAWLTEVHVFDLTPIKVHYHQVYGGGPGKIRLQIKDLPQGEIQYEFSS